MFYLFYRHASFFAFIISKKNSATYAFHMCVETKQTPSNKIWYDINDRYCIKAHVFMFLFSVKKTRVWIVASLTLKVTSWGYPMHDIYRPSLSLHYKNLFKESMTLWLWMSGKRNVSVCRGHELANALYSYQRNN